MKHTVSYTFLKWRENPNNEIIKEWMDKETDIILRLSKGRVLDIGCGYGYVLELLKEKNNYIRC